MPDARWRLRGECHGADYEARFEAQAAAGQNVHGEADFVERLGLRSVLDAGCGTGRLARELARRGLQTVGVDRDGGMLAVARSRAPHLEWHEADLVNVHLERTFDGIVLAGNVMIFLAPGTEGAVLTNLAQHLSDSGLLVTGFQLFPRGLTLERYDTLAAAAGLELVERWATWDRAPWQPSADYAVSAHRRRSMPGGRSASFKIS
jgi:SAM-dependent methyltransferase